MADRDPLLVTTAQTLRALLFVLKDLQPPDIQNDLADMMARLDLAMGVKVPQKEHGDGDFTATGL
jgi:hypothetical protein